MEDTLKKCIVCKSDQKLMFKYMKYDYHICTSCALVSTYPLPDSETIDAHYKNKFKKGNYQLLQEYAGQYARIYEDFVRILGDRLQLYGRNYQQLRLLDVGCFTGEFLEILHKYGVDVYGLELQEEAVELASKKLPGRIFKADVFSRNFPQIQCDVVTLMGVIEHVTDPVKLLTRSSELLRKDGILMLQTPNSRSSLARVMRKYWPPFAPVEHIHLFSRKSLENLLKKLGYVDIEFKQHWKKLPISYVYNMFYNFGPEFYKFLGPIYKLLPGFMTNMCLPFYVGETIVIAKKGK